MACKIRPKIRTVPPARGAGTHHQDDPMTNKFIARLKAFQLADEAFEALADDDSDVHSRAIERRRRVLMAIAQASPPAVWCR